MTNDYNTGHRWHNPSQILVPIFQLSHMLCHMHNCHIPMCDLGVRVLECVMHNVYMRVSHMMYLDVHIHHLDHDHDMT